MLWVCNNSMIPFGHSAVFTSTQIHVRLLYVLSLARSARSFSRVSHGCASLLCQWVLLHGRLTLCNTQCQWRCRCIWDPRYPYQLFLVPTHVVFVTMIPILWYLIVSSRGMLAFWYWFQAITAVLRAVKWRCFCDLKRHGSAFSHSQTVWYSQIPLNFSKQIPF